MLAVSVLILRYKQPDAPRPWRVPLNLKLGSFELPVGLILIAAVLFTRLTVEVDDDEVRIVYGYGWPIQHIRWDRVAAVQTIQVRPTEWGGWGYRWVPWKKGTAAVMRAGSGFRFDFPNGKVFVVTVDDADAGLEVIRGVLATK